MSPTRPSPPADGDPGGRARGAPPTEFSFFGLQQQLTELPLAGVEAGRVIEDFRLIAPIGQGGMGQVWEAEQISLGRRVALKLVRPDRVNEHALELFAREARAGGRLSHAGIVSVHGHGHAEGIAWIAMELVEGAWTLKDFIEAIAHAGEVPVGYYRRVAELAVELADALSAAHEANVIHRDLKPANVLITPDEHPKVTDFGLAKITDETALSVTGDFAGTYAYMSPEQVTAKRMGLDHRTDIFSLGIVLYELLALRRPFEGDTTAQVAQQIVTEEPTDLTRLRSRIPSDLTVITGKCLEKSPDRRYASMRELADDLRRHLASEPILAKPPTTGQRAAKWIRRHPTRSAVAAVGATAFVAISLLLLENVKARQTIAKERTQLAEEIDSVERLSDQKDLDDLIAEVEGLWPAHPDLIDEYESWIRRAQELVNRRDVHEATLEALRDKAIPRDAAQLQADREGHSRFEEWRSLEAEWKAKSAALNQRRDGVGIEVAAVTDWSPYPDDWKGLLDEAWPLVHYRRPYFGREGLGLRLCERAQERIDSPEAEVEVSVMTGWAQLALGRLEDAEESLLFARDSAAGRSTPALDELATHLRSVSGPAGLSDAGREVATLDQAHRELDEELSIQRDWQFPDDVPRGVWWNDQLTTLIAGLDELADEEQGLLSDGASTQHGWAIPRRLEQARRLRDGFAAGGEFAARWEDVAEGLARTYPGLELPPQMGLVPLRPDVDSKYWEFWQVLSGDEPEQDGDRLVIGDETGIVLVLVPGGDFSMGQIAALGDPSDPNPIQRARKSDVETPVHDVQVSPFFLSKYELTIGQWVRMTGIATDGLGPFATASTSSQAFPMFSISWHECADELARFGLALPSEAEWEYGARGGTRTTWWTGDDRTTLGDKRPGKPGEEDTYDATAANLLDASAYARSFGLIVLGYEEWLYDPFDAGAPVDTMKANAFGLHHVHGNVREWCADDYDPRFYSRSPLKDPLNTGNLELPAVVRGGSWFTGANAARSASRGFAPRRFVEIWQGVRPARAIAE